MTFVAAKCPQCGGALQVPDDKDVVKCMYCGVDVVVRQAIQLVSGNTKNFLELAKAAEASDNRSEAYDYYTKVLEIEPTNAEAWFGKGKAAGWQSNLKKLRFSEIITAFENCLKFSPEEGYSEKKIECADVLLSVGIACYKLSQKHAFNFPSVATVWSEHNSRQQEVVLLLKKAHEFDPKNTDILKWLELLVSEDNKGTYTAKIKFLEPGYSPPKAESSNCFVVTATMGNVNHPTVTILRSFRDELLIKSKIGTAFINWYYEHGPAIARRIAAYNAARLISFLLIVAPAASIAFISLKLSRKLR